MPQNKFQLALEITLLVDASHLCVSMILTFYRNISGQKLWKGLKKSAHSSAHLIQMNDSSWPADEKHWHIMQRR